MRRLSMLLSALLFAVGAAACNNDTPTSSTSNAPTTTEVFTDVVTPFGAKTHPFTTARSGTVTGTLLSLDPNPDSKVAVGMAMGTLNGVGTCQLLLTRDVATVGTVINGTASSATTLCFRVYDAAGTLTEPTTYSVQVVHP